MTIAQKLTKIAENQEKFYDSGYQAGYEAGKEAGHSAGYADGVDTHMGDYIRRCNAQKSFLYAFAGPGWRDTAGGDWIATYVPRKDMVFDGQTNSSNMYAYSNVADTVAAIDLSGAVNNVSATFANATKLVTIRKLIVSETTPTIGFAGCGKLENLTVEGTFGRAVNLAACGALRSESVQNVVDHLKDLTGEATLKLTLHANVGAAMTDAQKAAVTAKNWTLIY